MLTLVLEWRRLQVFFVSKGNWHGDLRLGWRGCEEIVSANWPFWVSANDWVCVVATWIMGLFLRDAFGPIFQRNLVIANEGSNSVPETAPNCPIVQFCSTPTQRTLNLKIAKDQWGWRQVVPGVVILVPWVFASFLHYYFNTLAIFFPSIYETVKRSFAIGIVDLVRILRSPKRNGTNT